MGATPVFGDFSVDFNLARRIKFDDPTADRWLPYVTGTYTFNDNFNASLGAGYYLYDDKDTADFFELYAGGTATTSGGAYFTGEFYWEPDSDGADNAYYAVYGTVGVPFAEKFEAIGKVGWEGYEDEELDAVLHLVRGRPQLQHQQSHRYRRRLSWQRPVGQECPLQAYTDCGDSVFATLTLKGNLKRSAEIAAKVYLGFPPSVFSVRNSCHCVSFCLHFFV